MVKIKKILVYLFVTVLFSSVFQTNSHAARFDNYTLYMEDADLELHINEDSLAVKIVNKDNGYIWSSDREFGEEESINSSWKNRINSGITVEYHDKKKKRSAFATVLGDKTDIKIEKQGNDVIATIDFTDLNMSFTLIMSIKQNQFTVTVPYESIKESEDFLIKNIMIFPFLGSTDSSYRDGYVVVPDGCGTIMEYGQQKVAVSSAYQAKVYGYDEGTNDNYVEGYWLSLPIYGIVNGIDSNAFYTDVKSGSAYAVLNVYPAGVITNYNWTCFSFSYRQNFFLPTGVVDGSMTGFTDLEVDKNEYDISLTYTFLTGKEASYTGIAKDYQDKLVQENVLSKNTNESSFLRLEFLGAEIYKTVLGFRTNVFTKVEDVETIVEDLQGLGITPTVTYSGTSKGGKWGDLPNKFPFERKLGSNSAFKDMIDTFADRNIPLYFEADYTYGRLSSKSVNKKKDIIKKIDFKSMTSTWYFDSYSFDLGILSINKIGSLFQKDVSKYTKNNMNIAINSSARFLSSDYGIPLNREEAKIEMGEVFVNDNVKTAYYTPNEYMWNSMDKYFNIPLMSSRYLHFTKDVPLLEIVLKGYVDYFSPIQNTSPNPHYDILKMIEYGAYPAFVVTKKSPYDLSNTPSSEIFSSEYDLWKEKIISAENMIKSALKSVTNAHIVDHTMVGNVSITTYDNGVSIYVNYSEEDVTLDGNKIESKSFFVDEVR